jgi:hypothetical protein
VGGGEGISRHRVKRILRGLALVRAHLDARAAGDLEGLPTRKSDGDASRETKRGAGYRDQEDAAETVGAFEGTVVEVE